MLLDEREPVEAIARDVDLKMVAPAGAIFDRTGTGDHFEVAVASPRFDGLSLVEQHRLVYDAMAEPLADGTIHELRIKTKGSR